MPPITLTVAERVGAAETIDTSAAEESHHG